MRDSRDSRPHDSTFRPALTRRESLALVGGATAWLVAGGVPFPVRAAAETLECVARPEQTEGPYFVDEGLDRSDLRSDPADGSVRDGVALALALRVSKGSARSCAPLAGAKVDLWHCDARGVYSDVRDPGFETVGSKFLRGYQLTAEDGIARFVTIYPGWYPSRAVHIHFKIRSGRAEFTSQLYFDDALSDRVLASAPYARPGRRTRNEDDGIFSDGGEQLVLKVEPAPSGYVAEFNVRLV